MITINVKTDVAHIPRNIANSTKKAQFLLTQQVLKDSNTFIPADTWALRDSSLSSSNFDKGQIVWNTPYARRLYYGTHYKFSKDKNMWAQSGWFKKAEAVYGAQWTKLVTQNIKP